MDRSSSRFSHYIYESRARSCFSFFFHLLVLQENHTHTLKYRWVGWSHPDPHGVQLKTFLRVMKRLRSGDISQVEMNVFHTLMYKTNHVVKAEEWQDILSRAYVFSIRFQVLFSLNTYVASHEQVRVDRLVVDASAFRMCSECGRKGEGKTWNESWKSREINFSVRTDFALYIPLNLLTSR